MIGLNAKLTGQLNGQVVELSSSTTPGKRHAVTEKWKPEKKMNLSIIQNDLNHCDPFYNKSHYWGQVGNCAKDDICFNFHPSRFYRQYRFQLSQNCASVRSFPIPFSNAVL